VLRNGATSIVPMWRNDRGNTGLADSVRAAATASGVTVTPGVRYEPDTTDFAAALAELSTQLQTAIAAAGADKVAVYLAGFEEVGDVLFATVNVARHLGVAHQGAQLRGEAQPQAFPVRVEQGLLSDPIAPDHELAAAGIPEGEGKHAMERADALGPASAEAGGR